MNIKKVMEVGKEEKKENTNEIISRLVFNLPFRLRKFIHTVI
jgi:hypothetical protein